MLKACIYPVPAKLEVGEGQQLAWPFFVQALPLELSSLSSPHTGPDVPPGETAQYSSRAGTSRPHSNAADTKSPCKRCNTSSIPEPT